MKLKRITAAAIGAAASLLTSAQVFAAESTTTVGLCNSGIGKALCDLKEDKIGQVVGNLINAAFVFAAIIALGYLIWGGIKWITSGGEKSGVEGARNHIIAAIIGLVVIFLSYFIINIILYIFLGMSLNNLTFPQITSTP